jgi:hypothetical protein
MVIGSLVAPFIALRAMSRGVDRPFAIAGLVIGSIDFVIVAMSIIAALAG